MDAASLLMTSVTSSANSASVAPADSLSVAVKRGAHSGSASSSGTVSPAHKMPKLADDNCPTVTSGVQPGMCTGHALLRYLLKCPAYCWFIIYSVSQKKSQPPWGVLTFFIFFTNGWEFLIDVLHTYYTFLSTLDYKFLFNYPQFWRSYAILSATTQFT